MCQFFLCHFSFVLSMSSLNWTEQFFVVSSLFVRLLCLWFSPPFLSLFLYLTMSNDVAVGAQKSNKHKNGTRMKWTRNEAKIKTSKQQTDDAETKDKTSNDNKALWKKYVVAWLQTVRFCVHYDRQHRHQSMHIVTIVMQTINQIEMHRSVVI